MFYCGYNDNAIKIERNSFKNCNNKTGKLKSFPDYGKDKVNKNTQRRDKL